MIRNLLAKWLFSRAFWNAISMLLSGLSIGWLVGMSVAPVIQSTISTLLALLVGVLSLAAGLNEWPAAREGKIPVMAYFARISLGPMALFLVGLSGGAAGGLYTRSNQLLAPNAPRIASQWATSTEDSLRIIREIYQLTFSAEGIKSGGYALHSGKGASFSLCEQANGLSGQALKSFLLELAPTGKDSLFIDSVDENNHIALQNAKKRMLCDH